MVKLFITSIASVVLVELTLFFALSGSTIFASDNHVTNTNSPNSVARVDRDDGKYSRIVEKKFLNPSVFSVINIRYEGETYIFSSDIIQDILGNEPELSDVISNYKLTGKERIEKHVSDLFVDLNLDKKSVQRNIHGINKDITPEFSYYEFEKGPDINEAIEDIYSVISVRLKENYGQQDYIQIGEISHLGTNGEFQKEGKYLELDHSSQQMYAWEDGQLYRSWYASGFYDEYAVFGVFKVINKSKNAWSPIAEKWMPYWMAFYFDPIQQAWFGLHELVYWYDDDGNYIEESSDSIGLKKSGGCVRLDRGEMKVLYDWAEIDMPFLIHE